MVTGAFSGAKMLVQMGKFRGSWCMHQLYDAMLRVQIGGRGGVLVVSAVICESTHN